MVMPVTYMAFSIQHLEQARHHP